MNKRQKRKLAKQKILASYQTTPKRARQLYREERIIQNQNNAVYNDEVHALKSQWQSLVNKCNELVTKIEHKVSQFIDTYGELIHKLSTYDLTLKQCLDLNHTIDSLNDCLNAVDSVLEEYDITTYSKGKLLGVKKISDYLSVDIQKNIIDLTYRVFRENILDGNRSSKAIATLLSIEINNLLMNTVDRYHEEMTEGIRQEIDKAAHYVQGNSNGYWTADDE